MGAKTPATVNLSTLASIKAALSNCNARFHVTQFISAARAGFPPLLASLVQGKNRVRIVVDDADPPDGFEPVEPSLADAYAFYLYEDRPRPGSIGD